MLALKYMILKLGKKIRQYTGCNTQNISMILHTYNFISKIIIKSKYKEIYKMIEQPNLLDQKDNCHSTIAQIVPVVQCSDISYR